MSLSSQKTIKNEIRLDGVGLHTGLKVKLVIKPSEVNSGFLFKRTDIDENKNIIEASYDAIIDSINWKLLKENAVPVK